MDNIYRSDFLRTLPLSAESDDVANVPTANKGGVILLNRGRKRHAVLALPSIGEIEALVASVEQERLDAFWQKFVLAESRRFPGLIGAFAGWSDVNPSFSVPRGMILTVVSFSLFGEEEAARGPRAINRKSNVFDRLRKLGLDAQRAAINELPHSTFADASQIVSGFAWNRFVKLPGIRPSDAGITDPSEWMSKFVSMLGLNATVTRVNKSYLIQIACAMRASGWILLPTSTASIAGRSSIKSLSVVSAAFSPGQQALLQDLLASVPVGASSNLFSESLRQARVVVFSTSLNDKADVTLAFAIATCTVITKRCNRGAEHGHVYRSLCTMAVANGPSAVEIEREEQFLPVIRRYCGSRIAEFSEWLTLLAEYRRNVHVQNIISVANHFRPLFTWLTTLKSIPAPTTFSNDNAALFVAHLNGLAFSTRRKNSALARAVHFLTWLERRESNAGRLFSNPLNYEQLKYRPQRGESRHKAAADRVHSWILQELREMLVANSESKFSWSTFAAETTVRVGGEDVFCPILPAILYLLIRYPLRSNQALYLDSGELDNIIYSFEQKRFVENPVGIPRRCMGLLQPSEGIHRMSGTDQIDFQVTINKRLLEEQDRAEYTIPWIDEEAIWVIQQVVEWQKNFGATPTLVRVADGLEGARNGHSQEKADKARQAQICCLFRYPSSNGFWPPTYNQAMVYWRKLGQAWDSRNASWKDPSTGTVLQRPHVTFLTVYTENEFVHRGALTRRIDVRPKYGLHSLRVSGVSRLLDLGVPLGVVSSMVGHRGYAMTLYYYRTDLPQLRAKLNRAQSVKHVANLLDSIDRRLRDLSSSTDYLCGSKAAFGALERARSSGGLISISLTGICPGASCADGLEDRFKASSGLPVPGSRCVFCKYRLYGPPFIDGLVQEYNHLLYGLREAGRRLIELRDRRIAAVEQGKHELAAVLQAEDEELDRQTEIDSSHWAKLHNMINQAYAKLQTQITEGTPTQLLINNPEAAKGEIPMLSWEYVPDFDQETEILKTAAIMPASKSTIPQQVMDRMQNRLVEFLVRNDLDPFLIRIPRHLRDQATLLLAEVIRGTVTNATERAALVEGTLRLSSNPRAEAAVEEVSRSLGNMSLVNALSSESHLAELLGDTQPTDL